MPVAPTRFRPSRVGVAAYQAPRPPAGAEPCERKRAPDRRGSAHQRGYGHRWQQTSKGYLLKHPLCCCHEANGLTAAAVLVDHVMPHRSDMTLFWDRSNWQGLCKSCHDIVKKTLENRYEAGTIYRADLHLSRRIPEFFPA